jgi:hypothetical protein
MLSRPNLSQRRQLNPPFAELARASCLSPPLASPGATVLALGGHCSALHASAEAGAARFTVAHRALSFVAMAEANAFSLNASDWQDEQRASRSTEARLPA